jgi:IS30 family transposase
MVRRKVPKGTNFDGKTDEEIQQIENWINGYPRRILGYRTAGELFKEEIHKLPA